MCATILAFLTIRLLLTGEIQQSYREVKNSKFILIFCALAFLVSLFYQNWPGAGCSVGILMILSFVLFYRRHINKELFEFLTTCIVYMSVFAALYALVEYIGILNKLEIDVVEIIIFNSPKYRVNSMFYNANYYAMMIEFFVAITFYKLLQIKEIIPNIKKIFELLVVIGLNLFCLYLTGCRTAWPALMVGVIVLLFINRNYKICATIALICIAGILFFIINPQYFPRVDNIVKYFGVRTKIWSVAIQNIQTHPLFGEGPMTYWHVYANYHGHPTEHAHNIILDPLLCFGIVGIASILPFIGENIKELFNLYKKNIDRTLVALVVSFTFMIFIHGMMDYTIFFVQTGFLYLLIASSFDVYHDRGLQ